MRFVAGLLIALGLVSGVAQAQPKETVGSLAIADGSKVQIEYTLKDDAGKVLDSNAGGAP